MRALFSDTRKRVDLRPTNEGELSALSTIEKRFKWDDFRFLKFGRVECLPTKPSYSPAAWMLAIYENESFFSKPSPGVSVLPKGVKLHNDC